MLWAIDGGPSFRNDPKTFLDLRLDSAVGTLTQRTTMTGLTFCRVSLDEAANEQENRASGRSTFSGRYGGP